MNYRRVVDGANVSDDEATNADGTLRDGYCANFSVTMTDAGKVVRVHRMADAASRHTLRDAAGKPARLYDAASGGTLQLTDHLIAAIESEAAKAGLPVDRYVADVLRYSPAPATTR